MTELDALVGLRFEVSGGLGRMSGIVLGKVGGLYLVQKAGSEHMELLMLDDLRSAKFYEPVEVVAASTTAEPADAAPAKPAPEKPKRRLSDQIRKHLTPKAD